MGMLDELKKRIEQLRQGGPPGVDPATFGDALALKTQWTPLSGGGANFKTHKLVMAGPGRYEFRVSVGMILFGLVFALFGVGAFSAAVFVEGLKGWDAVIPLLVGMVFTGIGIGLVVYARRPIVFDRASGWFWKGKQPHGSVGRSARACRLGDVHAIQLVREYVSGKSSYYSYELNLVLKDGTRICVVDHGSLEAVREDAQRLASANGWKVWDAAG